MQPAAEAISHKVPILGTVLKVTVADVITPAVAKIIPTLTAVNALTLKRREKALQRKEVRIRFDWNQEP